MQPQEKQEWEWKRRELIWDYDLSLKNIEKLEINPIN
jgi:hypothetical protein